MTEDADPPIDQEVKEMHQESIWMRILSLLMFGTPGMHICKLREITVDQIVSQQSLIKYSESMVEEWRDVALYVGVPPKEVPYIRDANHTRLGNRDDGC